MAENGHGEEVQWLLDYCARHFIEKGTWPETPKVRRAAARAGLELDGFFFSTPPRDFLFRRDYSGVALSVLGLAQTGVARPLLDGLVGLARLCAERYLDPNEDESPRVSADDLRAVGVDDTSIDRLHTLLTGSEYFLTGSGGGADSTHWYFDVTDTARRFSNVETLEDYLRIRHNIVDPEDRQPPSDAATFVAMSDAELLVALEPLLHRLRKSIDEAEGADPDEQADAQADLESANDQLRAARPNRGVIRAALERLRAKWLTFAIDAAILIPAVTDILRRLH